jgi:two-component system nitrogen regulation response regulator GlnG
MRSLLGEILTKQGLTVIEADDGDVAVSCVASETPSAVVLDVKMPRVNGLDALLEIKRLRPDLPVVILTAHGDIPMAVEAMRRGAYDYLSKPFRQDHLTMSIRRALERRDLLSGLGDVAPPAEAKDLMVEMGSSRPVQSVARQVAAVGGSELTVLIQGETGTGKELVARAVHQRSGRPADAFVAVDCGALPDTLIEAQLFGHTRGAFTGAERAHEGHFRRADGGSLFLDEIGNLPLGTQAKLLRVLQERQVQPLGAAAPVGVNARIIAASNLLLKEEMLAGRFRADLYYRISEFTIVLPALRERCEDIPYLAERFLQDAAAELKLSGHSISDEALQLLVTYAWPGNVRELRNIIRRAAVVSRGVICPEHLSGLTAVGVPAEPSALEPTARTGPRSLKERAEAAAESAEREAIREALEAAHGNKSEAARLLRIDYKTLHVKMRRYAISAEGFRPN